MPPYAACDMIILHYKFEGRPQTLAPFTTKRKSAKIFVNFDVARKIVLNRYNAEERANLVQEDGLICVSYGDEEHFVITSAAVALGISELTGKMVGEDLYVCFGDKSVKIPLENEGVGLDSDLRMRQTLQTLNEALSPKYEIRRIQGEIDFGWYIPLDAASRAKLEQEFGWDAVDETFERFEFDTSVGVNKGDAPL
jgi:hypothetical protein